MTLDFTAADERIGITQSVIDDYRTIDHRFREDLGFYCGKLVKIRDRTKGDLIPFMWNAAQRELHARLERQKAAEGWVRAMVLKGRKMGISTYVAARFYNNTSLNIGRQTFILTHEDEATANLFGFARTIHNNMDPDWRPLTDADSQDELKFSGIECGYKCGTAGNTAGTGRSQNIHNFHGSEVAFWKQAATHYKGALSAVPTAPGTEIILESTANGIGGTFHDQWVLAEKGESDFMPVFLPWFIDKEYRRDPRIIQGYEPSREELDYGQLYGLDEWQVCWMHFQNIFLEGRPGIIGSGFRQEFPAISAEAFQAGGEESFIPSEHVTRARNWTAAAQHKRIPIVLGVDCARGGRDKTVIMDRQGRKAGGHINEKFSTKDPNVIVDKIAQYLNRDSRIVRVFVDVTDGFGAAIVSLLHTLGFTEQVQGIHFGASATDDERYMNKRVEMWGRAKEWLADPGGADIPDDDSLHRQLVSVGYKRTSNHQLQLEAKESVIKRLKFSPDDADAFCLTFAETVHIEPTDDTPAWLLEMEAEHMAQSNSYLIG